MTSGSIVARAAQVLSGKNSISICLPNNPTLDAVAAGTALYMGLSALGKNVGLASDSPINPDFGLLGQDKFQSDLIADGDNLVVSFPYQEGSVDKVTYNIEGEVFNLIIQPREGVSRLDPKKVQFSYAGGKPEAIVTIYAPTLNSLGKLHSSNTDQFTGVDIVNIDRHFTNANFGSINFVNKKSASMSEMIFGLLKELKVTIDKDIATNLYAGIASATNNFSAHTATAETFEAIAELMKSGAVKKPMYNNPMNTNKPMGQFGQQTPSLSQPFGQSQQFGSQFGQPQSFGQPQPFGNPLSQPQMGMSGMGQTGMGQGQQFGNPQSVLGGSMSQFGQPQQPFMNQNSYVAPLQPIQPVQPTQMTQQPQTQQSMQIGGASAEFSEHKMMPVQQPLQESSQVMEPQASEAELQLETIENKEVKPDENMNSTPVLNIEPQQIKETKQQKGDQDNQTQKTPKDWLKPKIFKGTNLV